MQCILTAAFSFQNVQTKIIPGFFHLHKDMLKFKASDEIHTWVPSTKRELTATKQRTKDNSLHSQGLYVHLTVWKKNVAYAKKLDICICKEKSMSFHRRRLFRCIIARLLMLVLKASCIHAWKLILKLKPITSETEKQPRVCSWGPSSCTILWWWCFLHLYIHDQT